MNPIPFFLALLMVTGGFLVWEARTGRLEPRSALTRGARVGLFFAASTAGGGLLLRTLEASPLLALALLPVTALSLYRFVALVRVPRAGRLLPLALALALFAGLSASLHVLPKPLDQRTLFEHILYPETGRAPVSIDPAARRSARV